MKDGKLKDTLIYGWHPVFEAVEEGKPIQKVFIQSGPFSDQAHELWSRLKGTGIPVARLPKVKLDKMANGNHQGVAAFISPVEFMPFNELLTKAYEAGKSPFFSLLDGVTDVRNIGAIARSALAFDLDGLILPSKHTALLNADAIKSSAGALLRLPLCRSTNVIESLEEAKASGLQIICVSEKAEEEAAGLDVHQPMLCVLGAEGQGIREDILELADRHVRIGMSEAIDSLNVSVAAGIVYHSLYKKRKED